MKYEDLKKNDLFFLPGEMSDIFVRIVDILPDDLIRIAERRCSYDGSKRNGLGFSYDDISKKNFEKNYLRFLTTDFSKVKYKRAYIVEIFSRSRTDASLDVRMIP